MAVKIYQPRCHGRSCYHEHNDTIAKKIKGVYLVPGSRFCTGGKKIRKFKPSDKKIYVPSWCPLRKSPSELRIYHYKNSMVSFLRCMLEAGGTQHYPSAHEYALRYEGTTPMTASEFHKQSESSSPAALLGLPIQSGEIIEINDGLEPYYFYMEIPHHIYTIRFDGEKARKNKLEDYHE